MIKRKGQIIPKSICRSIEKKAQHLLVFNCDVNVINGVVTPLAGNELETCIIYPKQKYVLKRKQNRTFKGINFIGCIKGFGIMIYADVEGV